MKLKPLRCPQCGSTKVIKQTYKYGGKLKPSKITCEDCNKVTKADGKVEDYHGNWWPKKAGDPRCDTGDYMDHLIDRKD